MSIPLKDLWLWQFESITVLLEL